MIHTRTIDPAFRVTSISAPTHACLTGDAGDTSPGSTNTEYTF